MAFYKTKIFHLQEIIFVHIRLNEFIKLYFKSINIQTNRIFLTSPIRYSRYLIIHPAEEHLNLIKCLIFLAIKRTQQQEVHWQSQRERMYIPHVYIYYIALSLLSATPKSRVQNEQFIFLNILTNCSIV